MTALADAYVDVHANTEPAGEDMKHGFLTAGKAAAIGAAGLIGVTLAKGIGEAFTADSLNAKLTAQLGLTQKQSKTAGEVSGKLFGQGYGTGMDQINDAVKNVVQNIDGMRKASDTTLQDVSGKALTVAQVFDQDLGGVTRAVSQLMRTGLAKNADQAFDIITRGFQTGADKSDDFLDTLNEYGTQFRKLGLNGKTATGLLSQGLKGGARDADLVADSLKEFAIRAVDGSKTTAQGFKAIGVNGKQMAEDIAKGGPTAEKGLEKVLDGLRGIEDPAKRSRVAVKLFGTQAEDLGGALYKLHPETAAAGLGKVADATDKANAALNDTPSAKLSTFGRELQQGVINVLANDFLPLLDQASPALTGLGDDFVSVLAPVKATGAVLKDVAQFVDGLPGPVKKLGGEVLIAALVFPRLAAGATAGAASLRLVGGAAVTAGAGLATAQGRSALASAGLAKLGGVAKQAAGVGGMLLLAQAAQQTDKKLGLLEGAAGGAATGFAIGGPLGAGIGAVTGGLLGFISAEKHSKTSTDNFKDSLNQLTGALTANSRTQALADLQKAGAVKAATTLGISTRDLVDASLGNAAAQGRVADAYAAVKPKLAELSAAQKAAGGGYSENYQKAKDLQSAAEKLPSVLGQVSASFRANSKDVRAQALATASAAQLLRGFPKRVTTAIDTQGFPKTYGEIVSLQKRFKLTPKQVATLFKVTGVAPATHNLDLISGSLKAVGKAKPDLAPFTASVKKGGTDGQTAAKKGATGIQRELKQGTGQAKANLAPFVSSVQAGTQPAVAQARTGGHQVGAALKSGIIAGFAGTQATLAAQASAAVGAAIAAAKHRADAHSPSREMGKVGRDMGDGLIVGMAAKKGGAAKAGAALITAVLAQVGGGSEGVGNALDRISALIDKKITGKNQAQRQKAVLASLKGQYAALQANGKAQDAINAKLDTEKAKLDDLVKARADYASTVSSGITSFAAVTSIGAGDGAGGVVDGLKARLAQVKTFVANIATLTKDKLNATSLQQIVDAGVDGGYNTAQALADGDKTTISQINSLAAQISAQGKSLGASTSSAFYDAGVAAQQGLVKGLTANQAGIKHAADVLATELVQAVKRKLKIKSPSQVFRDLGQSTAEGLQVGLGDVNMGKAGSQLAGRLTTGFGAPQLGVAAYSASASVRRTAVQPAGVSAADLTRIIAAQAVKGRGPTALAAGDLIIRETVDIDRLMNRQAFLARAATVG